MVSAQSLTSLLDELACETKLKSERFTLLLYSHVESNRKRCEHPRTMSSPGSGGSDRTAAPEQRLPPEQKHGLDSLKAALQDVSQVPGATVHYAVAGQEPPPQIDAGNIGTRASDLQGRDFIVAPSADGRCVDVVERIDLPTPDAIRTDLSTGFGAHEGPVTTPGADKEQPPQ